VYRLILQLVFMRVYDLHFVKASSENTEECLYITDIQDL